MRPSAALALAALVLGAAAACEEASSKDVRPTPGPQGSRAVDLADLPPEVRRAFQSQPGFSPLPEPRPGDWLAAHPEPGQSVAEWQRAPRVEPTADRKALLVLPLGAFPAEASPPLPTLAEYVQLFYRLPVRLLPGLLDTRELRVRSRRHDGVEQWLTAQLLDALRARVPEDAYGLVGVTMTDLFPDPSWNYVFGEARFDQRVGVYSFARYDPAFYNDPRGPDTPTLILVRAMKVMTHEIGHMLGMAHCTAYRCLMNGTNSLEETDAMPLHLCPVCLRKLHLAVGFEPARRYQELQAFYAAHGLKDAASWVGERRLFLRH